MNEQIYTVIGSVSVGIIVSASHYWNAKLTGVNALALKEKEIGHEFEKSEIYFLRGKLEELHIILSDVALENSQTMSCIQSSDNISLTKYRKKYINICRKLHSAKAIALYFPEIREGIDRIYGKANIFWGTQELILKNDISENPEIWHNHCKDIRAVSIEISNLVDGCSTLISKELNNLLQRV